MSYAQPPPQYAQPQHGQPCAQPTQMGALALPPGTTLVYVRASSLSAGSRFFGFLLAALVAHPSRAPHALVALFPPQVNGVPGYYTTVPYCGPITCLFSCVPVAGFFACCFPCDTKKEFVPLPAQQ